MSCAVVGAGVVWDGVVGDSLEDDLEDECRDEGGAVDDDDGARAWGR